MSREKIDNLNNEVAAKLEEIRQISVATDTPAYFRFCDINFHVFDGSDMDEETAEYYRDELGIEVGDWVSSSSMC